MLTNKTGRKHARDQESVQSVAVNELLRAVAAKASSIHERLNSQDFLLDGTSPNDTIVAARIKTWCSNVANGDMAMFQKRLGWDGLTLTETQRVVQHVRLREGAHLPSWTQTLGGVLEIASHHIAGDRCLDANEAIPFEEILLPFVVWGRSLYMRAAGEASKAFADVALAGLERQLLIWLSRRSAHTLWVELQLIRLDHGSFLDQVLQPAPSRDCYDRLVTEMRGGGFIAFFDKYSVLSRLLSTTTELWAEATAELLLRFSCDREVIREFLDVDDEPHVRSVASALSDPHNGLRSVAVLTLATGKRIVYKPRNMAIEAGWNDLLLQLREWDAPISFRTFRVLDRGDHGWAEHVPYAACADVEGAGRYFKCAGALLALVHLLGGIDCHAGNVVASGDCPVIVDLETMLTPQVHTPRIGAEATNLASVKLQSSVVSTYLLPCWTPIGANEVFDGGGFGVDIDSGSGPMTPHWADVNTDLMTLQELPLDLDLLPRAGLADGTSLRVHDYESDFVNGFVDTYRFLARNTAPLLGPDSSFMRLSNMRVRFVHRNTSIYAAIAEDLNKPGLLCDGADRSIHIEKLAMAALEGMRLDGRLGWVDLWRAERDSMEQGDVPHFSAVANSLDLWLTPIHRVKGWFSAAGQAAAEARLRRLDECDLAFQVDVIKSALRSRAISFVVHSPLATVSGGTAVKSPLPMEDELWLSEAVAVANSLKRDAIPGSDASYSWLQPVWSREFMTPRGSPAGLDVVGSDLYDGAVGIGLFLAAAEFVKPDTGIRAVAMGAVQPLLVELDERGSDLATVVGIGGFAGVGSIVYGLVSMGKLLDEHFLLQAAERAADLITADRIDSDSAFDVTLGSAGALLGLLSLYGATKSPSVLARARLCAARVMGGLELTETGEFSIRTLNGRFLSGFSHGAAGISYALCRLYGVTGDDPLLDAARSLVAFERSTFSVADGDWPDRRQTDNPHFLAAWCHGAPGIALARIGSLGSIDDAVTRKEIDDCLAITCEKPSAVDHMCCGEFGLVQILSTAGTQLGRPELCARATVRAQGALLRARKNLGYTLALPSAGTLKCRSLFRGEAGIGYTVLQLIEPNVLPEVLLLR